MKHIPILLPSLVALSFGCGSGSSGPTSTDSLASVKGPGTTGAPDTNVAVTTTTNVKGLLGPVDVLRDKNGMVHIYATSAVDAFRVEAYQMARDRTTQVEFVRRTAEGTLSEILGTPDLIDQDIVLRAIGLKRVAQQMYDAMPSGSTTKKWLDAYADGITQFNANLQSGLEKLPAAMVGVPLAAFGPWTGVDVLAVARLQAFDLSYSGDDEVAKTRFVAAAKAVFNPNAKSTDDQKRAGFLVDTFRFAPLDPTSVLAAFPTDATPIPKTGARLPINRSALGKNSVPKAKQLWETAVARARGMFGTLGATGSNNWVLDPTLTGTGHAMLANDPHLALSAPPVFWAVHVNVTSADATQNLDFAGMAFPGILGVILGFNEHVAWGATTANYDVSDVYQETLTPDGGSVIFKGAPVALQTVHETINVAGAQPIQYNVQIVPQHGVILPNIDPTTHQIIPASGTAISSRWTGQDPTHDIDAIVGLLGAQSVDSARFALLSFGTGAENWVVADTGGNILYSSNCVLPTRDKRAFTWDPPSFSGTLPIFVLPGDGSAEWTGALDERFIPHAKNPATHYIATANAQQVPRPVANDPSSTVLPDGTPIFLSAAYDTGLRAGRIHQRIDALASQKHPDSLDDMADIQADVRSPLGARLVAGLLTTLQRAAVEKAQPGTHPDLTPLVSSARFSPQVIAEVAASLKAWGTSFDYSAESGINPDDNTPTATGAAASNATILFNTWRTRMVGAVYADELAQVQATPQIDLTVSLTYLLTADPKTLATYDATLGDSILFDDLTTPGIVETRDQRQLLAMLDAIDFLNAKLGTDQTKWRWGAIHALRFDSIVPLWASTLSIPAVGDPTFPQGFSRHGDGYNIDVGTYTVPVTTGSLPVTTSFAYDHGPAQRFVIDMDPKGPQARNVLPGGNVWDNTSPHFRDEAELWRRNENHPVPFSKSDVAAATESHVVYR